MTQPPPPTSPAAAEPDDGMTPASDRDLKAALEAILMVIDTPASVADLAAAIELDEDATRALLTQLTAEYQGRGFVLREVGGGWRIYSAPAYAPIVGRFLIGDHTSRLTQAALETLAVIAYRQPLTRTAIGAIRGVSVDGVIRTLLARNLVEVSGTTASGASLYVTTAEFLTLFGLNSLADLPALAPYLPDMEQLGDVIEQFEGPGDGSAQD